MPRHLSLEFEKHQTPQERLADRIARFAGSLTFVYLHLIVFSLWIILNILSAEFGWDPYPFNFLTLIVSLEAIFLSTFVLIVQNREAKRSDLRAQLDYEVNLKAEAEVRKILTKLEAIQRELANQKKR